MRVAVNSLRVLSGLRPGHEDLRKLPLLLLLLLSLLLNFYYYNYLLLSKQHFFSNATKRKAALHQDGFIT
jgi:hypothetical protein